MRLERLTALVTAAFVCICLGFALVIVESGQGMSALPTVFMPPSIILTALRGTQSLGGSATPLVAERAEARKKIEALIATSPEYACFFDRLREEFPVDYEFSMEIFAARLVAAIEPESVDFYISESVRLLRQSRGALAAAAEDGPIGRVIEAQLEVLRAVAKEDKRMCVAFVYGETKQDFHRFAAGRRALIADLALAGLEAIANGVAEKTERAVPKEEDLRLLESALAAKGLDRVEIDMLLDGKMPAPLDDLRMCAAAQIYLEVLSSLPRAVRSRIFGLAMELMASYRAVARSPRM